MFHTSHILVVPDMGYAGIPLVAVNDDAAREQAEKILAENGAGTGVLFRCEHAGCDPLVRLGLVSAPVDPAR
jgi:hypothetical protein